MSSPSWSVSKSGSKDEVIAYVEQTLPDNDGPQGAARDFIVVQLRAFSATQCSVSGSGSATSCSLPISSWEPTPAA